MGIKHSFSSSKPDGGDTSLVQPSNWNANHQIDSEVPFPVVASPATPAANFGNLFMRLSAGRTVPSVIEPSGQEINMQQAMWRRQISLWVPPGNATTVPGVLGLPALTATGTATARTVATTNALTRMRRLGYVSAATAGSLSGARVAAAQVTTGDGAGLGGFFTSIRFGCSDAAAVSGARMFVGMSSSTAAPTNVDPAALTNAFGVAQLATDATQLYLVYGGSAAQTAIALGTGFPPANAAVAYDLLLWCNPGSNGTVSYKLIRLDTNTSVSGDIVPATPGTQTPLNTTLLCHQAWRTNNATALAVGLDLCGIYLESGN